MSTVEGRDQDGLPAFASDIRDLVGKENKLPPVEKWHPDVQGEIDIRIATDGVWYYRGAEMTRIDVVKLLSSILRKDGDEFFLVTPTEKMKIQVEDLPFIINIMDVEGENESQRIHFSTQFGDCLTLSKAHPLQVTYNNKNEPAPFVSVRHGLDARISRAVYYDLAELAVEAGAGIDAENEVEVSRQEERFGLWSDGSFFVF